MRTQYIYRYSMQLATELIVFIHYVELLVVLLVLSDSAFFTITIVAKAIFTIFDSITIVHFLLINEI